MNMTDQELSEADGLAIFDDVHEVRPERASVIGLHLATIVLSYSIILGIVVVVAVVVVLAVTLAWPFVVAALFPELSPL
ncbi:hypothetical protein BJQ94_13390 [Cryobacterium sp. SO2]|uniref:hypothetical protein n=1 Tax=Cryobacterium sp. SO2 TaxID=1897060 RepID=UPI00223D5F59|nr:hypothetical protein [Cryobacterium sp. SO2]WEO76353.1 hypothetical protein BJQ94_13390 [Cryobacterium sp. SO2]